MCVGSLDHLDNCKSFGVFNIFKSMFKNSCIFLICFRKSLPVNGIRSPIKLYTTPKQLHSDHNKMKAHASTRFSLRDTF